MECERMLLVLSVLEGRHFPKKANCHLSVEARFDGESMTTDPVEHTTSPNFNTELAWEVNRRGFHVTKTQKTPVKVACLVQNNVGVKESVGYVILDITLARQPTMKAAWFPLLNSQYRSKPELLLTLGLEDDVQAEKQNLENNKKLDTKPAGPAETEEFRNVVPVVVDDGEYYQVGPAEKCTDFFTFSITIGFGSNLEKLLSSTMHLPPDHDGFFFSYTLVGNDIYTDTFTDLLTANFMAERATIVFRSSVAALRSYFSAESKIQVHLCCGDQSLGRANVNLNGLLPVGMESFQAARVIEDSYQLKTSRQSQMHVVPDAEKPLVAVVLSLAKEENVPENVTKRFPAAALTPPSVRRNLQYPQTPPQKLEKEVESEKSAVHENGGDPVRNSEASSKIRNDELLDFPNTPKSDKVFRLPSTDTEDGAASADQPLTTYSFSVDLRTVKNLEVETPFNCFLRYSYVYFDDVAPMLTHPTVDVRLGCSSILPHGFSTFRFMTKAKQLEEVFRKNPIKIEVLRRDSTKDGHRDTVVGFSMLHLGHLLDAETLLTVDESGKSAWRRSMLTTLPVISKESRGKVAEIQLFTALDDFGPSESEEIVNDNVQSQKKVEAEPRVTLPAQESLEDRLSEQAALEIERWKQWQEASFLKQLRTKETEHIQAITSEWTTRETERELLVQKKLFEYQNLEDKLTAALTNIEERERQLSIKEAENERLKNDFQLDYERLMQELKDTSRRYKEECNHKIELEKIKTKAVQEQCVKLQRHVNELEKNLEVRDAQSHAFHDTKAQSEIRLQSELNLLKIEKVELDRKVQALTKSKVHYKQQYGRCLGELKRLKQAMHQEAQAQLREQKQELDQIRTTLMSSNINQRLSEGSSKTLLDELKSELIKNNNRKSVSVEETERISGNESRGHLMSKRAETELARLMDERDTLLRTGCYAPEDLIIRQLDEEINRMILSTG